MVKSFITVRLLLMVTVAPPLTVRLLNTLPEFTSMDCVPEVLSRLTVPLLNEKLPAFTRLPAMITVMLAGHSR